MLRLQICQEPAFPLGIKVQHPHLRQVGEHIVHHILGAALVQLMGKLRLVLVPQHCGDKALHNMGELGHRDLQRVVIPPHAALQLPDLLKADPFAVVQQIVHADIQ